MNHPLEYLKITVDNIEDRVRTLDPKNVDSVRMIKIEIASVEYDIKERRGTEQNIENVAFYDVLTRRIDTFKNSGGVGNG